MCVIIVKKKGVKLPTRELLKAAFDSNPDGCGFATASGYVWKGLSFETFYKRFKENARVDDDVMIHFRWATHGSVRKGNCHPFVAREDGNFAVFMHNGILGIPSKEDKTDSEICFREKIVPVLRECSFLLDKNANKEIEAMTEITSKFAMIVNGEMRLFGNWQRYGDLICSNLRFLWALRNKRGYYYTGTGCHRVTCL